MAGESFRYRTVVEVAGIAIILYVLLGAPGLYSSGNDRTTQQDVPVAKAKVEQLVYPSPMLKCERHDYGTHIFSTSPLVVYIENFLSEQEVQHLIDLSDDAWNVSTVSNQGIEAIDDSVRKSEKAAIKRDQTVQCIEQRALSFQGWPQETFIERLWTQRYNTTGHYALHYDWGMATKHSRRVSSFMVYLKGDCVGGGTQFPRLPMPQERKWCQFIECNGSAEGVIFKPLQRSAVFWMNFDADGRGYKETIHAGLPIVSGQKIGLNIWSWYQAGHKIPTEP
ncbi:hypothetical protein DOTSEDRAFT_67862 [Dothistroma septosporum NZE10]|uniref:Prolyl 4-hydroxylase alpha subunit domain-containing protein n=1 Tax=Dothistroma septosporum (strain NZE10 / CBS 128990) TaxID=675120 RepID=N1Q3B1_DOTSN|nr:hypothetical protein DOTSEDRAFT_67862 [Dothistroma septosporum NZE10]